MQASAKTRNVSISARVFRAETGKWEDLGIIAKTTNSNPKSRVLKFINTFRKKKEKEK